MDETSARQARSTLVRGLGRRGFLQAVTAVGAGMGMTGVAVARAGGGPTEPVPGQPVGEVLQPHAGRIDGQHYLPSDPDAVLWGYVPSVGATPALQMASGETVTIDSVSHEGILEDQGRDPVEWFGRYDVAPEGVLEDAVAIAAGYDRTPRNFDVDGPHVVTGPVFVEGAEPGDVLKIETLSSLPRVPYGVISSRHGKGALPALADAGVPAGITRQEIMPPVDTDGRSSGDPEEYGNVSIFTPVRWGASGDSVAVLPWGGRSVEFPLRPFMGLMGVAYGEAETETDPLLNSIPPTLGGGNIDIRLLGAGSAFYLPVAVEGALFHVGDPHMAMGDGEVALTAMEGSLRSTFRLTVCKPGSGDAPSVAYHYPFAETPEYWIPVGLSDPDGSGSGAQGSDLDVAMRRAVVNALDFLEHDQGMDRAVAYAYLSAAADFTISQVVDRTVGVHGVIQKSHFGL